MAGQRTPFAGPIGLDLGGAAVKAAQTLADGSLATAIIPRDEPGSAYSPAEFKRVAGALRRMGLRGSRVIAGAPRGVVRTNSLELASGHAPQAQRAMARADLARMHGLDPSAFELMTWPSPQPPKANPTDRLLAAVCAHAEASALVDGLEAAGLEAELLVPASLGLASAFAGEGLKVILDLGWHSATLIACRGGALMYERSLGGTSLARMAEEIVQNRGVDPTFAKWAVGRGRATHESVAAVVAPVLARYAEALSSELRASLGYLSQCMPSERFDAIEVVGGAAADEELLEVISDQCGTALRRARGSEGQGGPRAAVLLGAIGLSRLHPKDLTGALTGGANAKGRAA
jgi:hypothetical protein